MITLHRFTFLSPTLFFIIVFAVLCLLYVWQMTVMSLRSYIMNDLVQEKALLLAQKERTHLAILEQQALTRVEERFSELQLVRDPRVEHVTREELRLSLSAR